MNTTVSIKETNSIDDILELNPQKVKSYESPENAKNLAILNKRKDMYDKKDGARVGDYIIRKDGSMSRATYDWDDSIQDGGFGESYYLGNGYLSYSGCLNPSIDKSKLSLTDEKKLGKVWFFSNDIHEAHNGINAYMFFRVFQEA